MKLSKIYIGIFFISVATLLLEISLIRFFSVSQWYHFAFMVVSIALFGIAASGTFLSIKKLKNPLLASSILFSLTTLFGFIIVNQISFDPYKAILNYNHLFKLFFYYIFLGTPFFFSGLIVAFILSKYQKKSGKIYFFNMSGAAIGSLLAIPLISFFNVKVIFVVFLLGLISSLSFTKKHFKLIVLFIFLSLLLFFLPLGINISEYKELNQALNYPEAKILQTKWNSFSRVDVIDSPFVRYAPGVSQKFKGKLPKQIGVSVDGSSVNAITNYGKLEFINYLPNSLAYKLKENPNVLVINSGVGLDVLAAIKNNATVTALEANPIITDLLKTEYSNFSGNIYNKANVYNEEGRSFIKKGSKYDIIVLSLAGNVLSSSAGLYGLSENYLLTTEAFQDYYNSLTENGFLIITRWLLYPPRESLRLTSLALQIKEGKEKIAIFRSWTTVTLLLSKENLTPTQINKIKNFTNENKFDIIYLPSNFTPNIYGKFKEPYYYNGVNQILENKEEFYDNYLFDVKPVYDEKPFYFNFFKWKKLPELYRAMGEKWQPFLDSGFLLLLIFIQALILSLIFILLPLKFFKNLKLKKLPLVYFFCIGISYLFIEIVLIQKLILFLGQVIYSVSTVIFSMLLFSSLGSLTSQKFKTRIISKVVITLAILILLYSIFLPYLLNYLITLSLITKIVFSAIIIAPLAFIMGFPFPLGIRIIDKSLIPWSWAVNGSASVLSTILAVLIALSFGYSLVLLFAALIYLIGLFVIRKSP